MVKVLESSLAKLKAENATTLKKSIAKMKKAVTTKLDSKQVLKAVKALKKHSASQKKGPIEDEPRINLTFSLTKVPLKPSPKPVLIELAKPLHSADTNSRICLIVKDPEQETKDVLAKLEVPTIADVIGVDRLKREFKQYKDKRALLADFDGFLADLRVYKMLPEIMGKNFYTKKQYPAPIKLHGFSDKELQDQLNSAAAKVSFMPGNGPNYSVRIGTLSMSEKEVVANAEAALGQVLGNLACWDDIAFADVAQVSL